MTDLIQTVVGVLSILLALVALFVSWKTENRTRNRFLSDQDLNKKIAEANMKPILSIWTTEYINKKGITLINCGTGTAIITKIAFSKQTQIEKNIAKLFTINKPFNWDTYWTFSESKYYIQAGQEIPLVRLSLKGLESQKFDEKEALEILKDWQTELEGIRIEITYYDVLNNQQPLYDRTLHS